MMASELAAESSLGSALKLTEVDIRLRGKKARQEDLSQESLSPCKQAMKGLPGDLLWPAKTRNQNNTGMILPEVVQLAELRDPLLDHRKGLVSRHARFV